MVQLASKHTILLILPRKIVRIRRHLLEFSADRETHVHGETLPNMVRYRYAKTETFLKQRVG